MNKTIHFKIVLCFNENSNNLEVLESNSLNKTKKRVILILNITI